MNIWLKSAGALAISAGAASAGGIDRSVVPYALLFEKGTVVQLSYSHVNPNVSGQYTPFLTAVGGGVSSTNGMAQRYSTGSFGFRGDFNEKLSYALILNTPFGADALYTGGFYAGLEAHWSSEQLTGLLRYKFTDNVSVYGGFRYLQSKANINIPGRLFAPAPIGDYTATALSDKEFGYVVGLAYELPSIALRVGLTYESSITHNFTTRERFAGLNGGATLPGTTNVTIPQTIALDFQTGIAKDTLLFGSVRWAEWTAWSVRPSYYDAVINNEITGFADNVVTYQLGIGRKINESLSVFARAGYERSDGSISSRLAPTDGYRSIGIGATWKDEHVKITGGIEYVDVGDAFDASGVEFSGNNAVGFGISMAYTF